MYGIRSPPDPAISLMIMTFGPQMPADGLVNDCAELVLLGEVVTIEARVSALAGVRHVHVCELALRQALDRAAVFLYPRARAQSLFAANRQHHRIPRAFHHRFAVHGDSGL